MISGYLSRFAAPLCVREHLPCRVRRSRGAKRDADDRGRRHCDCRGHCSRTPTPSASAATSVGTRDMDVSQHVEGNGGACASRSSASTSHRTRCCRDGRDRNLQLKDDGTFHPNAKISSI